jgi:CIC family chloride channel protein
MWVSVGVLIGVAAGLGSLVLYNLIRIISGLLLTGLSGFIPPLPRAEGGTGAYSLNIAVRGLIPLSTTIGGLVSGYLVYRLSPGTEGLGINAAIHAFHNLTVRIRNRTPAVKLAASAIVIGSGGSAGRDGPIALISAVFGSFLADRLGLDDHDRRIVMASAIGAGFGSIFMAPIGGALMSTEILYRKDFEVEALIPAVIASVVGYAIFGFQFHYTPLFMTSPRSFFFLSPSAMGAYAVIGVFAGFGGKLFVKLFDAVHRGFLRLRKIPVYLKPAVGGLIVGCIGLFFPQVLGLGYGWVQMIMNGQPVDVRYPITPVLFFAVLFFLKILATSITIGSGSSGGVFAPSIVSGAFLGAGLGIILHGVFPSVTVAEATIVTMLSFFAGVSKMPVSMLIMGTEMAGGLDMFVPLTIAVTIAYFTCGAGDSIYRTQVINRLHSSAHLFEFRNAIMNNLKVSDAMKRDYLSVTSDSSIKDLSVAMRSSNSADALILDHGRFQGYVTKRTIQSNMENSDRKVSELPTEELVTIRMDKSIHDAITVLPRDPEKKIVVVDEWTGTVVGTLGFTEIADAYENAYRELKLAQMKHKPGSEK